MFTKAKTHSVPQYLYKPQAKARVTTECEHLAVFRSITRQEISLNLGIGGKHLTREPQESLQAGLQHD